MPRSERKQKRPVKRVRNGGGGVRYAESDDSSIGGVSDYVESDSDSRCSTPESQKNTVCSVCNRHVASSDKSLQCDKCNEWCHIKCGGVTKEHYKQMVKLDESNIPIQWYCPPCDRLENPHKFKDTEKSQTTTATTKSSVETPVIKKTTTKTTVITKTTTKTTTVTVQPNKAPQDKTKMPPTITNKVPVNKNTGGGAGQNRLVFPDIKVRDLPFFPIKAMLLRPCLLNAKDTTQELQTQNLAFYLSPEQANMVNKGRKVETNGMVVYKMHVLLRFSKKSEDGIHDDDFPKNLVLKVNNKVCPLPNPKPVPANRPQMEAKRPPKPLIVTSLCKLNTKSCLNQMSLTWTPVPGIVHAVSVYLVEKLGPADLLDMLKGRGQRDPEITKTLIRSKLEDKDQDEIATTSCKVTMACPLGMSRMTYPARSSTCDHLQCFDGDTYLRMNEKKPKWLCPVCNKPAYFENLFLDGFYIQLLQSQKFRTCGTNDIVLNQDASWEAVITEGVGVSDDSEDEDPLAITNSNLTSNGSGVITLADTVSQLAKLPITQAVITAPKLVATPGGGVPVNIFTGTAMPANNSSSTLHAGTGPVNDDFINEATLSTEDNYSDWNYSVKFFSFIRTLPDKTDRPKQVDDIVEIPNPPKAYIPQTNGKVNNIQKPQATPPPVVQAKPKPVKAAPAATAPKRGGGRSGGARGGGGRGRGSANKRSAPDYDDSADLSSEEEIAPPKKKAPQRGGAKGGRTNASAAKSRSSGGGRNSSGGGGAAKKKSRYVESSDEESSESETEVLSRPVITKSGRPSRNCRQSTNYADIEESGNVLDYLLENR